MENKTSNNENILKFNDRLAQRIIEEKLLPETQVKVILKNCNSLKVHLGQTLLRQSLIKANELAKLMQGVQSAQGTTLHRGSSDIPTPKNQKDKGVLGTGSFGEYEILHEIARGGMGIVYKAKQSKIGRIVALKVLLKEGMKDEIQLKRFEREAEATASLKHPGIVALYNAGEEGGFPYFTMQYVDGGTFCDVMENKKISLEQKLTMFIQVCDAMYYAHQKNIIHRDLKPANILMDKENNPYVTDFGLARFTDSQSAMTRTGSVLGTAFYMPPEQMAGEKKKMGPTADIYSLGVILYQILTNDLPFMAEDFHSLCDQVFHNEPPLPREKNPDVPVELEAICLKAMDKSITARYQTAKTMATDIKKYLKGEKPTAVSYLWKAKTKKAYRRYQYYIFAALVLVIASSFYWLLFSSGGEKEITWEDHWKLAKKEYKAGNTTELQSHLEKVLFSKPNYLPALALLEESYEQSQDIEKQEILWVKLASQTKDREYLEKLATKATSAQKWSIALTILNKLDRMQSSSRILAQIGRIYLYQNQFNQALIQYEKIPQNYRSQLIDYVDTLYQNDLLQQAGKVLEQLRTRNMGNREKGQKKFFEACLNWKKIDGFLSQWYWLYSRKDSKEYKRTYAKVADLDKQFQTAATLIQQAQDDSYFYKTLSIRLGLYQAALRIELGEDNEIEQFLSQITSQNFLATGEIILFQKVILRSFIRRGETEKVLKLVKRFSKQHPWVSEFRHFEGLMHYELKSPEIATKYIQDSILLDPWNHNSVNNLMHIFSEHFTQQEAALVDQVVNYHQHHYENSWQKHWSHRRKIYHTFFAEYLASLQREANSSSIRKFQSVDMDALQKAFLENDSKQALTFITRKIAENYNHPNINNVLKSLEEKTKEQKKNERWQNLQVAIQKEKERQLTSHLKNLALQYAALNEKEYVLEVRQMKDKGENSLIDIIQDSETEPMMRLLAARLMIGTRSASALEKLKIVAKKGKYPSNFIAIAALKEKLLLGFPLSGKYLKDNNFLWSHSSQKLYRLLLACHLPITTHPNQAARLINDKDPLVALAAISSYREYIKEDVDLSLEKVLRRLRDLSRNKAPKIRTLSCYILWELLHAYSLYSPLVSEKRQREFFRYWEDYAGEVTLKILQDPVEEVHIAGVQCIVTYWKRFSELRKSKSKLKYFFEVVAETKSLTTSSSFVAKFWAIQAFSFIDDKGRIWSVVFDRQRIFSHRFLALAGGVTIFTKSAFFAIRKMIDFMKVPAQTQSDRQLQQMMLSCIGLFNPVGKGEKTLLFTNFLNAISRATQSSKDPLIQRAFYTAGIWIGKEHHIKILRQYWKKAKNIDDRRAIAASITGLLLHFQPKNLSKWNRYIETQPEEIRKSVAWAYNDFYLQKLRGQRWQRYLSEARYEMQINEATRAFKQGSIPTIAIKHCIDLYPTPSYIIRWAAFALAQDDASKNFVEIEEKLQLGINLIKNQPLQRSSSYSDTFLAGKIFSLQANLEKQRQADYHKFLIKSVETNPFIFSITQTLADDAFRKGKWREARRYYWETYLNQEFMEDAIRNVMITYIKEKQYARALEVLKDYKEPLFQVSKRSLYSKSSYEDKSSALYALRKFPWVQKLSEWESKKKKKK